MSAARGLCVRFVSVYACMLLNVSCACMSLLVSQSCVCGYNVLECVCTSVYVFVCVHGCLYLYALSVFGCVCV